MDLSQQAVDLADQDALNEIDWQAIEVLARQIYHPTVFTRYCKRVNDAPFSGFFDDLAFGVRYGYVAGCRFLAISSIALSRQKHKRVLGAQFGTNAANHP